MHTNITTFRTYGAAITRYQTIQYMYTEGHLPLYISYVYPEQTKQDQHLETLKHSRRQRPMNKKGNKSE